MRFWLTLLARVVIFMMCGTAAFLWMLRAIQAACGPDTWAHPVAGVLLCVCISLFSVGLGVVGLIDPWGRVWPKEDR